MSETDLRRAIEDAMNATGRVRVWREQSGRVKVRGGYMHHAPSGTPDIVGYALRDGRFVACEVKVPGARTETARAVAQLRFREFAEKCGAISFVATSPQEAVRTLLGRLSC